MSVRSVRAQELWSIHAPEVVTAAAVARRTGEVFLALESGVIQCLTPRGGERLRARTEGTPVLAMCASDDGMSFAAAHPMGIEMFNRHGRRLEAVGIRDVVAVDLRRRDGTLFAVTRDRRLMSLARRKPTALYDMVSFVPRSLRAGDADWDVLVGGEYGDLALFGPDLELRWRIALKGYSGPVGSDVAGRLLLFPARDFGACAFNPEGESLGMYAPPTPAEYAVAAPGAERLAIADEDGGLYLLLRERGSCIWREEGRGPLLALGLGESHLVTVSREGAVRSVLLGAEDRQRGSFFELHAEGHSRRRPADWSVPLPPMVGPFSGRLAMSRDGRWLALRFGETLSVFRHDGTRAVQLRTSLETHPLWGEAQRMFLIGPSGITGVDVPSDERWEWEGEVRAAATGDRTRRIALIDGTGTVRVLGSDGSLLWQAEVPEQPLDVFADEDMDAVGVSSVFGSFFLLDAEGKPLWRRSLPSGSRALLAGKHVYFATADGEVSCYGYGEHRDWQTRIDLPVSHLFREEAMPFLATRDNRFFRLESEGGLTPLDRHSDTGTSRLVRTIAGDWRELHVRGRRLACFDLEGQLLWDHGALSPIEEITFTTGRGSVAFVAGSEISFLELEETIAGTPSGRYIEI